MPPVDVRDERTFESGAELRAHYAAVRRRLARRRPPPPAPVAVLPAVEEPPIPKESVPITECFAAASTHATGIGTIVLRAATAKFEVSIEDVLGVRRFPKLVHVRWVIAYVYTIIAGASSLRVGRLLRCDHSTVFNSLEKVRARRKVDPDYRKFLDEFARCAADAARSKGWPICYKPDGDDDGEEDERAGESACNAGA